MTRHIFVCADSTRFHVVKDFLATLAEVNVSAHATKLPHQIPERKQKIELEKTFRRCVRFAKDWGFGALCMTNLFAWRDTDPEDMMKAENPIGEDNQHHLLSCASKAGMVLAAWGKRGSLHCQDLTVTEWLRSINVPLYCLRKNDDGSPKHPLYVPKTTLPIILSDVVGCSHAGGASFTK